MSTTRIDLLRLISCLGKEVISLCQCVILFICSSSYFASQPFWRVWNAAGSDGRGVIGVLEANFVEPAHDKQGFERTIGLSRLEARLVAMQKNYWFVHEICFSWISYFFAY